jgi:hypothetical protein
MSHARAHTHTRTHTQIAGDQKGEKKKRKYNRYHKHITSSVIVLCDSQWTEAYQRMSN